MNSLYVSLGLSVNGARHVSLLFNTSVDPASLNIDLWRIYIIKDKKNLLKELDNSLCNALLLQETFKSIVVVAGSLTPFSAEHSVSIEKVKITFIFKEKREKEMVTIKSGILTSN